MKLHVNLIISISIILVLTSCSVNTVEDATLTLPVISSSLETSIPTSTIRVSPTLEVEYLLSTPTETSIPTSDTTMELGEISITENISKSTPFPMVSQENADEILIQFIQNNGGCKLPCLFGVTVSESNQLDLEALIGYFQQSATQAQNMEIFTQVKDTKGSASLGFFMDKFFVRVGFGYTFKDEDLFHLSMNTDSFEIIDEGEGEYNQLTYESIYYANVMSFFTLSSVLNTYGNPSEILIRPFIAEDGDPSSTIYPFIIILIYQEQGFLIQYTSMRGEENGNFYSCPTKSLIDLSAWNPSEQVTLEEVVKYFSKSQTINENNTQRFKPIEEVTDLSIIDFSKIYLAPDTLDCITTPQKFWKNP